MRKLNIRAFFVTNWQPLALYGGLFLFLAALLFAQLDSLLPGYSTATLQTYQSSLSWHHILQHPVNAPFMLAAYAISKLHTHHSLLLMRATAATLGLVTLGVFCGLLRYWHDARTAFFGTLLLGTSSWFLQTSRSGSGIVLMFGLFALVACGVWLRTTGNPLAVLLGLAGAAALVYVPGMAWLIVLGMVWQWKALDKAFKKHLATVTLAGLLFIAILAPLGWSLYHHPTLGKELLNLPAEGWPTPNSIIRNLINVPLNIFVHGQASASTVIRQLPVLDAFTTAMFVVGGYAYLRHIGLQRSKLFIAIFVGSALVLSLGGAASVAMLLPFLYLLIAVGVSYMLGQWFKVFPRNPIAQGIGTFAIGAVVALACVYHLRVYFVAFPQAASTKSVYMQREPAPIK